MVGGRDLVGLKIEIKSLGILGLILACAGQRMWKILREGESLGDRL